MSLQKTVFGFGKANTFIGGVASVYPTATALAAKLNVSVTRITGFKISGSDISCRITGGNYSFNPFTDISQLTYYDDPKGLVIQYNGTHYPFRGCVNLKWVNFPNMIFLGPSAFGQCGNLETVNMPKLKYMDNLGTNDGIAMFQGCVKLTNLYFPNLEYVQNSSAFAGMSALLSLYAPKCYSFGISAGNDGNLTNIKTGCSITVASILQTCNGGAPDGDIQYAIASRGATVTYAAPPSDKPNQITNLSTGTIGYGFVVLNFTAPSSVYPISYYNVYANGVLKNRISGSGGSASGLTPSTSYNIIVRAVNRYGIEALDSNTVSIITTSYVSYPITNVVSAYHLEANSNDSISVNNGVDTSVSYASGKIGNCGVYNGTTSKSIIGNPVNLQLTSGTISCWIKTSNAGSSYRLIFGKISAFALFLTDNRLVTYSWGGSAGERNTGYVLNDNAWHHVAMVFGSGTANGTKIYVDGVPVLTTTITVLNQTDNVCIGASNTIQFFTGSIDDAIISSDKLTDNQVYDIYNQGLTGTSPI